MPKPSLLQTILRQPSQSYSYSSSRDDASSDRATTNSYFSTKGKGKERASSIRSGVSSVSSYSQKSDYVSPLPRGNGGGGWEWATFGARKGLTGGPGSLRAPSDIVRASTDARGGDDERSLRSTRSLNSVRSAGTASGSLLGGWIPPPERERIARERERALEKEREREERASRRYSDMPLSSGLVVQTELEEGVTSRRYSSAIPSTSSNAVYDPRYQHPRSHTLQHATSSPQLSSSPELSTQQPKPRTKKKSSRSKLSSSTTTSPLVSSSPSLSSVTSSPTQQHHRRLNSLSQEGSSSTPTPSLTSSVSSAPSSSSVPRTPISTKIPEPAVFLREPDPYEIHSLENSDYVTVAPSVEKVQEKVKRKKTKKVVKKEADGGSSESGLVDEVRPRVSTIPEPTILLPFPSTEPVPTTVPLPDPSTFPAPSAAFDDSPVVGAVYTMDELFDSLCAAVAPAEEGEPGGAIPSQPEQDMPLTRMEHEGASPSVPEERESDNIDIKEQVSTVAPLSLAQEMSPPTPTPPSDSQPQQPKNETTTAAIPRISLTRTESDQAKTGVQGDVDVEPPTSPQPTSGSPPRPSLTRKSSKRRSSISKTAAPPVIEAQKAVYQVVASSTTGGEKRRKSTTPSSLSSAKPLTSANLAAADKAASTSPVNQSRSLSVSVSGTTAAQDAPQWLKNIRALGEPIQTSLVTSSAPASVRRSKSLSMSSPPSFSRLEWAPGTAGDGSASLAKRRPSLGILRTPVSSIAGSVVMEEEGEDMDDQQDGKQNSRSSPLRTHTPRSSISGALSIASSGGSGDAMNPTIPRRRNQSPHQQTTTSETAFPTPARVPSPQPQLETDSTYEPPRVHYHPAVVPPVDPTFSAPTLDTLGLSFPPSASELDHDNFLPSTFPPRSRAVSVFSNTTSIGGQSISGLTTMSVPIGAYQPSKNPKRVSTILASSSSSMTALHVSANAAAAIRRNNSIFRRRDSSNSSNASSAGDHGRPLDPNLDFMFGMVKPPPKKLKSDEVLVQVHAVGLDMWDFERAREMASRPEGFGWVPGRSFCGKALECGYDVSKIKRGDFVYGLQTLKKSGALAELMTVDRTLLTLAPSCGMSVEEIAALPHSGILASQIMETVCQELPKGSKILILNAHEGVGNLCMQLGFYYRTTRDMWVVAQCPLTVVDGDAYCRATGASDVIRDEPLATMNAIHESSFDVVIDTIGGRRLYDAARRILHFDGQFITTVGDSLSAATPTTQWKTSIRSLRRAFFPKDKKNVGYWAVNLDERELPRDALDKLRDAVELSGVRPAVRRVVAFDEAAKAFDEEMGSGRVVKIVEV